MAEVRAADGDFMKAAFLSLWLVATIAFAQSSPVVAPEVVSIDREPSHHLVFENEYVRVFSVEVAPHSETKYHQHDRDYVFVTLGDSDVESVRLQGTYAGLLPTAPVHLQPKDGDAQFTKGGFAHKAVNKSDKPFRNVTVELKKDVGETLRPARADGGQAGACIKGGLPPCAPGGKSWKTVFESDHWLVREIGIMGTEEERVNGKALLIALADVKVVGSEAVKKEDWAWVETVKRIRPLDHSARIVTITYR